MHGVFIEKGPEDWQILQQSGGWAECVLSGAWVLPQAAAEQGVAEVRPVIRVLREDDSFPVIPWRRTDGGGTGDTGKWSVTLRLPAGGLYRLETGLDTLARQPGLRWIFRGDVRLHVGVGDVFVIAGQSNASGYGRDGGYDPPDMRVHLYRNRGEWDLCCHPINESTGAAGSPGAEMGVSGTSPYLSFGKRYADLVNYPVGLIVTSQGGQPVSRWDTRKEGGLYRHMTARIKDGCQKPAAVLWYQGCSDTNGEAAAYGDSFEYFVRQLRAELGYEIPFFTYQLNRQHGAVNDREWGIVRQSQRIAAKTIPNVHILPSVQAKLSDGIHNGTLSAAGLGEHLARQAYGALRGGPVYNAPDFAGASCKERELRVRFAPVYGEMTLFTPVTADCGFTAEDSRGEIGISAVRSDPAYPDSVFLTLERPPGISTVLSFAWQADPTRVPPVDNGSFLPPLSFYRENVPVPLSLSEVLSFCHPKRGENTAKDAFDGKIIVLDDDPTGTQTVYGVPVYTDWGPESCRRAFAEESRVVFVLTNSRGLTAEKTTAVHKEIAENLWDASKALGAGMLIVSRSDSTLRGHWPLETQTLADTLQAKGHPPFDGEVICPFLPAGGRYTVGGVHYVAYGDKLIPAGETEFARDRSFGYKNSYLPHWIQEKTENAVSGKDIIEFSLEELREADMAVLTAKLNSITGFGKVIVNAVTQEDLDVFCSALMPVIAGGKRFLFRTAAAFINALGGIPQKPLLTAAEMKSGVPDDARGALVVAGSHTAKTSEQLKQLLTLPGTVNVEFDQGTALEDGLAFEKEISRCLEICGEHMAKGKICVLSTKRARIDADTGNPEDELRLAVKISGGLVSVVSGLTERPGFILAKGGITSSDVATQGLRIKRATVEGQAAPGVPVWRCGPESKFPGLKYIIFPGNVGDGDTLADTVKRLI